MKLRTRSIALAACLPWLLPLTSQAFYNPGTGRWLSRDPIEERGGENLHAFAGNVPTVQVDAFGLAPILTPGTGLVQTSEVGGKGGSQTIVATITGSFSPEQKALADRALCLVQKLIGATQSVPWRDTYWADLRPRDVFGVTFEFDGIMSVQPMPKPRPSNGDRWITVSPEIYPSATAGQVLLIQMKNLGGTLAHEADHHATGAAEDTVKDRVDTALAEAFLDAKARRLACVTCSSQSPAWRVKNILELFACQCGIRVR
jgi:hypothetical protein